MAGLGVGEGTREDKPTERNRNYLAKKLLWQATGDYDFAKENWPEHNEPFRSRVGDGGGMPLGVAAAIALPQRFCLATVEDLPA